MSRSQENTGFTCGHCGKAVSPLTNGSYRNHCPFCLYSRHVDALPGDRAESCGGLMEPVGILYNSQKGYQVVHRCEVCGAESVCKIAQDTIQPDDMDVVIQLFQMNQR